MDLGVVITGEDAGDELRSLNRWLGADRELGQHARLLPGTLLDDRLGVEEVLSITLGSGGLAASFMTVLITWIRRRTGIACGPVIIAS